MQKRNFIQRRNKGSTTVDLAITSMLMIVVGALGSNLTLLIYGGTINDSVCRDAARAAAAQVTPSLALAAAQSQLKAHATDGYFISQPTLKSAASPDFVYNDYNGAPPADTSPFVTVTTSVHVRLPAPIVFFGMKLNNNCSVQFVRRYTFPIVKVKYYG